ncbi:hypothetical protein [Legionella pneumophila]|nr:hypothetical protein [Legionella pneumophila]
MQISHAYSQGKITHWLNNELCVRLVRMSEAIANPDRQFAIKTASLPMRE